MGRVDEAIRLLVVLWRRHGWYREHPKDFTTTLYWKLYKGTQVIPVPNGNKVKYDKQMF